ncbi:hypothetical protein D3C76_779280 [compost metagenome]
MKDEQAQIRHYIKLFIDLFQVSSKVVKYVLCILLCLLIGFQIVLHIPSLRIYVSSVYRLDGIPMSDRKVNEW